VFRAVRFAAWCALALATTTRAHAQTPDYHAKLTVGLYNAGEVSSLDVNLRYSVGPWTGWVGNYRGEDHVHQSRGGVEYDIRRRWLFLVPSIQAASERFVGGSMYSEVGDRVYAIAGVSRTNLRPYVNLNFDPNESWQLGIGGHPRQADAVALFTVWDNRLNTGQQITHLIVRHHMERAQRVTIDVSYKSGHDDAGTYLTGTAEAIEYDRGRWFAKGARDAHANFEADTMWRLGAGVRF
jgi:hypothetical protein